MTRNNVYGALLACLLLASAQAGAQGRPQVVAVPLSNPGQPVTLDIDILSARIEVTGEERDDVEVQLTVEEGRRQIITPSGPKPLTGPGYELEIEEDDNVVSVDTDWRANRVNLVVRVPRNTNLVLGTTNNGEIIVRDVTGNHQLENVNGPITATGIRGAVIAESVNEDIDISFDAVSGDEAMSIATLNGDIRLAIPAAAGVQLHLDSGTGEIYSDFEVDVQPSEPVVRREENEDGIEVRIESTVVANINGGGPVIRLETLHGDIQIARSGN